MDEHGGWYLRHSLTTGAFEEAAEVSTRKVIADHSTISYTDGSIATLVNAYVNAEERVINELNELNKPYGIVLNSRILSEKRTKAGGTFGKIWKACSAHRLLQPG